MKKILFLLLLLAGCNPPDGNIAYRLTKMNSPVIVVSTGIGGNLIVRDGDGRIEQLYCSCLGSLNPGDTIK